MEQHDPVSVIGRELHDPVPAIDRELHDPVPAIDRELHDPVPAIDRELRTLVGERRHANWFQKTTRLEVHGDELCVFVGSPYLQSWLQRQFRAELQSAARTVLGDGARVRLEVDATLADATRTGATQTDATGGGTSDSTSANATDVETSGHSSSPARTSTAPRNNRALPTRRKFASLDKFIAGEGNDLALTAARQTADNPGGTLNPLFLYGGVGCGKTHLAEGIYGRIRRQFPALQVLFLTAENFANYFTQALREKSLPSFHHKFRHVDVLIVDDVDFFDGKRGIQEEFLHTLKSLESGGRQIVLTCDRHPRLLTKSSDELISRYLCGMSCRVEPPEETTRRQIVQQLVLRQPFPVADEALDFVAKRFAGNVRELAGAVNCLQTYHGMIKRRVTLRHARDILARLERDCIRIVRLADVELAVCKLFQLTGEEMKSGARARTVSQPRMLAMYLSRQMTQAAYSEIGKHYGGRNHSTVIAAERKVRQMISNRATIRVAAEDWPVCELLESLERQLRTGV